MPLLGVDTGGTFTDFVLLEDGDSITPVLKVHKVLSTPEAPEIAILQGIIDLGLRDAEDLTVIHGSTVATNAILENKGVRTVLITNYGLKDLLTLGRQSRRELYNLSPKLFHPPVPGELCIETGGRLSSDGKELEPLTDVELSSLEKKLNEIAPKSVAINLLFSWLEDKYEKQIAEIIPEDIFISRSSDVLPEIREYERGITTWLNASVGPIVDRYLHRLCHGAPLAKVSVMQSAGGIINAEQASKQAVHLLLSGPAGGMAGVQYVGQLADEYRLLSFDMGGTSTDVSLIDSTVVDGKGINLQLTTEGKIGDYPVGIPMVDMHTIGAGGGSIARVDDGGLLQVGPESAGANPGPACYGKGGVEPTVSDANLLLGRLRSDKFLGGNLSLDESAAMKAVSSVASSLGLSEIEAAQGIIDVANENMARALRVMSVQRGLDPVEFTLACFGGAGGLHVCALAESLGMKKALVPVHAGVLSALGMLVAPRARHISRTINHLISTSSDNDLIEQFKKLELEAQNNFSDEHVTESEILSSYSMDMRYRGQSYVINLPWQNISTTQEDFHRRHETLYGHRLNLEIELVTLRVKVQGPAPDISLAHPGQQNNKSQKVTSSKTMINLAGISEPAALYARDSLSIAKRIEGPALISESVSTTYIAPGWTCQMDTTGNLLLER